MDLILGNNTLITIAAISTPNKAAKLAALAGCSKEKIKAVRDAAKFRRDKGKKEFDNFFLPYELVDISFIYPISCIKIPVYFDLLDRPLNAKEYNKVIKIIKDSLIPYGIKSNIKEIPQHPFLESII